MSLACTLAVAMAGALPLSNRSLTWSGLEWRVHASDTPRGAGPNRWDASQAAVHVEDGSLVLTLQRDDRGWQGVELSAPLDRRPRTLTVDLEVGVLDSQVVAGVFLYKDDTSEIDLEVAKWGDPTAKPFQYAVAPADSEELLHRFEVAPGPSRHRLRWRRRALAWSSVDGPDTTAWTLRGRAVPRFDDHRVHVNLWIVGGGAPAGDGGRSVRIRSIQIDP